MVGLVQVVPIIALALPAGHVVDHVNRKRLIMVLTLALVVINFLMGLSSFYSQAAAAAPLIASNRWLASMAGLFGETSSHFASTHVPVLFGLLLASGVVRSFNQPAKQSLMPMLVPPEHFSNAVTWNSSLFEISNVGGPTLAGVAIAVLLWLNPQSHTAYAAIYFFNAFAQLIQLINFSTIRLTAKPAAREPLTLRSMLAGVRFVYSDKIIFGTITLDMFAVLLGGATALLPVFARDILQVGPIGLGCLRAAPSAGAFTMAMILAHLPPMRKAGRNMLLAVTGFGIATILFGVSTSFWFSLVALFVAGLCDNISVVVRHTLVQLHTPDHMRGRVNAVNSVFISSSNELGAFESGTTAAVSIRFFGAVLGPMIAVAAGGVGTILVVLGVVALWPQVGRVASLTNIDESEMEDLNNP
jgi:MFS family permease